MNSQEILETLRPHKQILKERYGVEWLAIIGVFGRNEVTGDSFLKVLVKLDRPAVTKVYFGVQFYIEDLLDQKVLLFTDKALEPRNRPIVEREAMYV